VRRFKGTATDVNGFVVNNNPKGPMNAAIYHNTSTQPSQNFQSQQNALPQSGSYQNHSNAMPAPQPKMNNPYNNIPHNRSNNIPVVNNLPLANTTTDDDYNALLDQMETHV